MALFASLLDTKVSVCVERRSLNTHSAAALVAGVFDGSFPADGGVLVAAFAVPAHLADAFRTLAANAADAQVANSVTSY